MPACRRTTLAITLIASLLLAAGCSTENEEPGRQVQASTVSGTVAFAHHSLWVRQNGVVSGQVKVRDASAGPYIGDGVELTVGIGAQVAGNVTGDSVLLKLSSSVSGDVLGNELTQGDGATIGGSFVSPLDLPLSDITPQMPSFQPGSCTATSLPTRSIALMPTGSLGLTARGRISALCWGSGGSSRV